MLNSNRANPSESDETRAAKRQQRTALKNCGHARRPSRAAAASNLCFHYINAPGGTPPLTLSTALYTRREI